MRILGACVTSCPRCTLWQMPKPLPPSPLLPVQLPKHRHHQRHHHHRHLLPNLRLRAQAHRNLDFHPGVAAQQQQGAAAAVADKRDDRNGGVMCAARQAAAFAFADDAARRCSVTATSAQLAYKHVVIYKVKHWT